MVFSGEEFVLAMALGAREVEGLWPSLPVNLYSKRAKGRRGGLGPSKAYVAI